MRIAFRDRGNLILDSIVNLQFLLQGRTFTNPLLESNHCLTWAPIAFASQLAIESQSAK